MRPANPELGDERGDVEEGRVGRVRVPGVRTATVDNPTSGKYRRRHGPWRWRRCRTCRRRGRRARGNLRGEAGKRTYRWWNLRTVRVAHPPRGVRLLEAHRISLPGLACPGVVGGSGHRNQQRHRDTACNDRGYERARPCLHGVAPYASPGREDGPSPGHRRLEVLRSHAVDFAERSAVEVLVPEPLEPLLNRRPALPPLQTPNSEQSPGVVPSL